VVGGPVPCRLLLLCSAASHSSDCDSAGQVFLQAGLPPNGANPCFVCLRLMALTTIQYKPTQDFEPLCSRVAIEVGICPAWTQQQTCDMGKPAVKQARQAYSERHSATATTVLAPNGTNPCMHGLSITLFGFVSEGVAGSRLHLPSVVSNLQRHTQWI
jgi:hypothetical protein